ncbi:MAG: hypothetical protein NZ703_14920, partial [Gemmataceae bacterium]|nr:hypothetical protein [Gemmataceae bacterium]
MERTVRQWLWRWLAAAVVVSGTALLTGMGVARSTSDEPNLVVLNDLRDAIEMADKQGVNVAEIREALDNLEKALRQQLKGPPDRKAEKLDQPPKELLALREAVEAAARKGENVDAIRKELEAVERRLIGRTLRAERPPVRPVDPPGGDRPIRPPVRPRPGGDDHAIVPPGLILPRLPGDIPGIDRELFDRAQKLRDEAFRRLLDNPNDQEALQKLEEATRLMLQAIGGLQEFPPFAPVPLPAIPDRFGERPRLGVRMERVPEALADQLGLEPGRGVLIADVLPD